MSAITINSKLRMNSGFKIPVLGYGVVFQKADLGKSPANICGGVVTQALKAGYRHVDCAAVYRNEIPAGKALRESGIPREEVFFTSKVYQPALTYEGVKAQVDLSLKNSGLGYLDLMLIHAPYGGREGRKAAWKALVESVEEGKVRSIGVSNYGVKHLDEMEEYMKELEEGGKGKGGVISVGQWEIHPWLPRSDIVEWCKKRNIVVEAYSPLVRGQRLDDKDLQPLIKKYGKSAAQILIRWSLQHGFVPLPKSVTANRIVDNATVYDFELTEEDIKSFTFDSYSVSGWDPTVAALDE
ncbi:aldo-keto reductase [Leptodontidium sp. 2 PMI_412]|nr:aldo-keto reductase [Leptodontidium sp. 2 PMI_412]